MSDYVCINVDLWSDRRVRQLGGLAKYVFLYILSMPDQTTLELPVMVRRLGLHHLSYMAVIDEMKYLDLVEEVGHYVVRVKGPEQFVRIEGAT